jgi:hypothetical protein
VSVLPSPVVLFLFRRYCSVDNVAPIIGFCVDSNKIAGWNGSNAFTLDVVIGFEAGRKSNSWTVQWVAAFVDAVASTHITIASGVPSPSTSKTAGFIGNSMVLLGDSFEVSDTDDFRTDDRGT